MLNFKILENFTQIFFSFISHVVPSCWRIYSCGFCLPKWGGCQPSSLLSLLSTGWLFCALAATADGAGLWTSELLEASPAVQTCGHLPLNTHFRCVQYPHILHSENFSLSLLWHQDCYLASTRLVRHLCFNYFWSLRLISHRQTRLYSTFVPSPTITAF